jgi:hypothetical protein
METKELAKIIKLARKNGATSLEVDGIKLSFEPNPVKPTRNVVAEALDAFNKASNAPGGEPISFEPSESEPSDSEMLFRSTPYYDVMLAEKKASGNPPAQ